MPAPGTPPAPRPACASRGSAFLSPTRRTVLSLFQYSSQLSRCRSRQGRLLYVDDPCADPNLAGEATAMPRRATFTCWRGVVVVDGGIIAWLSRRKRARSKRTPRAEFGSGGHLQSRLGWGSCRGTGPPSLLCPLNPTWRLKVAWRQKDHFVAPVRRLNCRPGVRRDFAPCSCGIPMDRQLRRGPSSHTLT